MNTIIPTYLNPWDLACIMLSEIYLFHVLLHLLVGRVFINGLGDQDSIPDQVMPKTQQMVLDAALLNTQPYKVWIKGKVKPSRERNSALPYTSVL